jgi:hypothetical protein
MSPVVPSSHELELVRFAVEHVNHTGPRFEALLRHENVHAIPFFGSLASARVLTFGLNPSAGEFADHRSWPARLSIEELTSRLVGYFNGLGTPPHRWFDAWSAALGRQRPSTR